MDRKLDSPSSQSRLDGRPDLLFDLGTKGLANLDLEKASVDRGHLDLELIPFSTAKQGPTRPAKARHADQRHPRRIPLQRASPQGANPARRKLPASSCRRLTQAVIMRAMAHCPSFALPLLWGTVLALSPISADAAPGATPNERAPASNASEAEVTPSPRKATGVSGPPDGRAFMVGVEGVILQAPPLRSRIVYIDPRLVGRSIAMGGLGVFGRYRPLQFIGLDVGVRSGSVRYKTQASETSVAQDQFMADAAVLLYLGRGKVAQFAVSGGLGGIYNRIGYQKSGGREGTQAFGSASFRLGAEAEFLIKRVAFVLSFRTYGVLTTRTRVRARGDLLDGRSGEDLRAPVPKFQTQISGSAGIASRF